MHIHNGVTRQYFGMGHFLATRNNVTTLNIHDLELGGEILLIPDMQSRDEFSLKKVSKEIDNIEIPNINLGSYLYSVRGRVEIYLKGPLDREDIKAYTMKLFRLIPSIKSFSVDYLYYP